MVKSFILRGALGFVIGGVLLTKILGRWSDIPFGMWLSVPLACAVLGFVVALVLERLHENQDRPLKLWSAGGWAVGGLLFCIVFRLLATRASSPTVVVVVPALFMGLFGGMGLGMGWRGVKAAVLVGTASAVLLPLSMWLNGYLISHAGVWLLNLVPLTVTWLKILAWLFGMFGFAIYGALMGVILNFQGGVEEEIVTAGPYVPYRRSTYEEDVASREAAEMESDAAQFATRRRGEPMMYDDTVHEPPRRDRDRPSNPQQDRVYREAQSDLASMFVGGRKPNDEVALQDDVALTPFEEDEQATTPPADFSTPRQDQPRETASDMSGKGTFRGARRNYHPDFSPAEQPQPKKKPVEPVERAEPTEPTGRGPRELQILRNYHPEFAPAETDPARLADSIAEEPESPLAPGSAGIPDALAPGIGRPGTYEVELEDDERQRDHDDQFDLGEEDEFDFLKED